MPYKNIIIKNVWPLALHKVRCIALQNCTLYRNVPVTGSFSRQNCRECMHVPECLGKRVNVITLIPTQLIWQCCVRHLYQPWSSSALGLCLHQAISPTVTPECTITSGTRGNNVNPEESSFFRILSPIEKSFFSLLGISQCVSLMPQDPILGSR